MAKQKLSSASTAKPTKTKIEPHKQTVKTQGRANAIAAQYKRGARKNVLVTSNGHVIRCASAEERDEVDAQLAGDSWEVDQ